MYRVSLTVFMAEDAAVRPSCFLIVVNNFEVAVSVNFSVSVTDVYDPAVFSQ
jgi:hypothetical protein